VGRVAITLAGSLYLWAASFGYLTFGDKVDGDLWLSYSSVAPGDSYITAVRTAFLLAILCTIPLIFFPMRKAITMLICGPDAPFSWPRHLALTAALLPALLGIAILVPSIKEVFSIVGATSSVMLVFLLPSSIFLRTVPHHDGAACVRAAARTLFVLGVAVAATAFTALAIPK